MPNLTTFSVLHERVRKTMDENQYSEIGIAFDHFFLQLLLNLTDEEVEEAMTDGPSDGEIDAIYISGNEVDICTMKYTSSAQNTDKNFPGSELDQFLLTVDHILSGGLTKGTVNDAVWDKYKEILNLFEKGTVHFRLHIASNKKKPIETAQQKVSIIIDRYRYVEVFYYDQEDLVTIILENKLDKINGDLHFIGKQHFEKANGGLRTIVGAIPATDITNLIVDPNNSDKVRSDIFNENVRVYKKNHRINKAIIESAIAEDNHEFFYLNNGITILCESCEYTPSRTNPCVPLTNIQIINGGQTSNSLFEAMKKNRERVSNVEILVRVCIARKNDPISKKISETSNNQIPVGTRDLHSNDRIQQKLEDEFLSLGYYYERKPNQYYDKPKAKRLNNELLGQLYMSYYLDMPSEAKNSKVLVFSEKYDEIFNDSEITAKDLLRLFNLYLPLLDKKKAILKKKRNKETVNERDAFISRATFHILNSMKLIYEHEENKIRANTTDSQEIKNKINALYSADPKPIREKATKLVKDVVELEITKRGNVYTHDKFFKEIPTNKIISTYISANLQ